MVDRYGASVADEHGELDSFGRRLPGRDLAVGAAHSPWHLLVDVGASKGRSPAASRTPTTDHFLARDCGAGGLT